MVRWAIYIDVEGSSKIYPRDEAQFFASVDALMDGIVRIGSLLCPETPNRLFVHQTGGDGFVIVSEFAEQSPEMPIAIAAVLMKKVLGAGAVAKSGISQGDLADVKRCYRTLHHLPACGDARYPLGGGLMTVFPVMGTALTNAHKLATRRPRGARLAVDRAMVNQVPDGVVVSHKEKDLIVVDWVHARTSTMEDIRSKAGIQLPPPTELEKKLAAYVASTGDATDADWKHYTLCLNGCLSR